VIRSDLLSVGIIAVDPSSPLTSGAVLGDRIRMQEHYLDDGVFIRSMGTRGSYGGLSKAVRLSVDLLDVFGKDIIIVETIGVGQSDVGIVEVADTVVLVLIPGYGDSVQFMKAGILEIADIIVVNKADHEGSEGFIIELQEVLNLGSKIPKPPIIMAQALNSQGIEEIYKELKKTGKSIRTTV
jgi:LAO/AO transport system kinase